MIQWDMAPKDRGPTDGAHPKTLDQIGRKGWKRSEDKRLEENKLKYLYRLIVQHYMQLYAEYSKNKGV